MGAANENRGSAGAMRQRLLIVLVNTDPRNVEELGAPFYYAAIAAAMDYVGDVLVFTPKRIGRDFEDGRSFATVEGGKWVGSARAAFDGVVVAHNESLIQKPELLMQDAYGAGWMLLVRPSGTDWPGRLVTGPAIAPMFEAWFARGSHKSRAE